MIRSMAKLKRFAAACGIAAPVVAILAVVVPTFLTPSFSWTGTSISHMGGEGKPAAFVLNYGLILAGLLGIPFVWRLWTETGHVFQKVGALLFALSVVGMGGVGVFPLPSDNHGLVAITHFAGYTFGLWVYGTGTALLGRVRWGLATIWLGLAHVLAWVVWGIAGLEGIALPELAGSVIFASWILITAREFVTGTASATARESTTAG
jgi:hypothetical membrane protein